MSRYELIDIIDLIRPSTVRHIYRIEAQHLKPYFEKYCLELYQKKRNVHIPDEGIVHINHASEDPQETYLMAPVEVKPPPVAAGKKHAAGSNNATGKKPLPAGTSTKLVKETNHMLNVSYFILSPFLVF